LGGVRKKINDEAETKKMHVSEAHGGESGAGTRRHGGGAHYCLGGGLEWGKREGGGK